MITNLRAFQEVLKRNNLPTPDTYLGISELIRSLYRPDVSPNPERIREVLEELTWPVTVPAGNPITFKSCSEVLASEALVTFAPKQSGSGDPSPDNVRPISGWDSVKFTRTGKNVLNGSVLAENTVENAGGTIDTVNKTVTFAANAGSGLSLFDDYDFPFKENTVYTFMLMVSKPSGNERSNLRIEYTDGTIGNVSDFNSTSKEYKIFTTQSNKTIKALETRNQSGTTMFYYDECAIIEGVHTVEDFEAYNGQTHTATFDSTVYGCSYDFVSGEGKSEWGYIAEYDGETINEPWISSIDVYTPGTTPSTGAEVVYKLETPTEITLTPEEIELLRGINNIWTDGDNVTVKFQILK